MDLDCDGLDWNPLASAPAHSQLAGVLAGLVFAGIVLLISIKSDRGQRVNGLVLFGAAFLVLAFDSFVFGIIAGEQQCARAWTETMLAAGLLGLGALSVFSGVCWVIDHEDDGSRRVTRFFVVTTHAVALIVGYHLAVTAEGYLLDIAALTRVPHWLSNVVVGYRWAILVLVLLYVGLASVRRRNWKSSPKLVLGAGYAYLVCVLGAAYMTGQTAALPKDEWESLSADRVVWTTLIALALPAIAILLQLIALPAARAASSSPN